MIHELTTILVFSNESGFEVESLVPVAVLNTSTDKYIFEDTDSRDELDLVYAIFKNKLDLDVSELELSNLNEVIDNNCFTLFCDTDNEYETICFTKNSGGGVFDSTYVFKFYK